MHIPAPRQYADPDLLLWCSAQDLAVAIVLALAIAAVPADASLYRRQLLEDTGNNCVNTLGDTLCDQLRSKCSKAPLLRFVCTQSCRACRRPQSPPTLRLDSARATVHVADAGSRGPRTASSPLPACAALALGPVRSRRMFCVGRSRDGRAADSRFRSLAVHPQQ